MAHRHMCKRCRALKSDELNKVLVVPHSCVLGDAIPSAWRNSATPAKEPGLNTYVVR